MFSQKSGKGTSAVHKALFKNRAKSIAAKLDEVTKILTDLKADLDTPKLSSQRTPLEALQSYTN